MFRTPPIYVNFVVLTSFFSNSSSYKLKIVGFNGYRSRRPILVFWGGRRQYPGIKTPPTLDLKVVFVKVNPNSYCVGHPAIAMYLVCN